eukprot:6139383-Prymnesium_polylepis.1
MIPQLLICAVAGKHIRAFVARENATANFKPLPAERLQAHLAHLRANEDAGGGLWAYINESNNVVTNYNQKLGGSTADSPREVEAALRLLASRQRSEWKTICEVGMNAGSSAVIWLHETRASLVEFDLFERTYSLGTQGFLNALFPNRTTYRAGWSTATLEAYARSVRPRRLSMSHPCSYRPQHLCCPPTLSLPSLCLHPRSPASRRPGRSVRRRCRPATCGTSTAATSLSRACTPTSAMRSPRRPSMAGSSWTTGLLGTGPSEVSGRRTLRQASCCRWRTTPTPAQTSRDRRDG